MTEKDSSDSHRSRVIASPHSFAWRATAPAPTASEGAEPGIAGIAGASPKEDTLGKQMLQNALSLKFGVRAELGGFTVLKELGQGGMGVVYACYDNQLDRKIAVKVLPGEMVRNEVARARLVREAQALARLSHPNIVTVHEVGQSGDLVFVAMEFVRGTTLDEWAAGGRPWRACLDACLQAGRGLAAAHRAGLVHRDFKPQNVMVTEDGLVKVLDFGLARAADDNIRDGLLVTQGDSAEASGNLLRPLTHTGTLLGTPAYMSAEQHRGEVATAASDQFSFCVSVYQCLYGVLPFSVRSLEALLVDVAAWRIAPVPSRSPVPMYIYKALRRGMAPAPAERFPSMEELLTALSRDPRAVYRRAAAMVGVAGLTGALSFAAGGAGSAELEVCPDAHAELAGIWDATRMGSIHATVQALASPAADEALTIAEPRLAGYAEAWVAMRNEACLTHAEGRQSQQLFDLRTSCLDRRRAGFDAVVGAFTTADSAALAGLVRATTEMPPLTTCADVQALTAAIPPPEDPATRKEVLGLRESLARAEALKHAGQFHAGLRIIEEVLPDVMMTEYEPLLIETLVQKGDLQMERGDLQEAITSLWSALWPAVRVGHDVSAAVASSKLAYLHASTGDTTAARNLLPLASALNHRVARDIDLYAEWLNNQGVVQLLLGDRVEAKRLVTESLELRELHGRARTWRALDSRMTLATMLEDEKHYEEALDARQRLLVLSAEILGAAHPRRLQYEVLMTDPLCLMGRPAEALKRMQRLADSVRLMDGPRERAIYLFTLGSVESDLGAAKSARDHLSEALENCAPEDGLRFDVLLALVRASALDGDVEATKLYHDLALAWIQGKPAVNDAYLTFLQRVYAQALINLGRTGEALVLLEPMEGAIKETSRPGWSSADIAMDIGEARRKQGDLDAAEQAFQRALTYFEANLPERSLLRAEALRGLGEVALQRGRFADAQSRLQRAEAIFAAVAEPNYAPLARTRFALARALTAAGPSTPAAARAHATRALEAQRSNARDEEARAIESWLADHP